jgi:hypothetical protein
MLPLRAQKLISEFSKPLTRPEWKNGCLHAKLFKYSPAIIDLTESFKNVSNYYYINFNDLFDDNFNHMLYTRPFNEIIQTYSELVFNIYRSYIPDQMNFYRYCRLTSYLTITKTQIYIPTQMAFNI